jgi:hypothetical protein
VGGHTDSAPLQVLPSSKPVRNEQALVGLLVDGRRSPIVSEIRDTPAGVQKLCVARVSKPEVRGLSTKIASQA